MPTETPSRTRNPLVAPPVKKDDPLWGNGGHDFEEVEHLVWPDDPDTALCGADQTDVEWDNGLPKCRACVAVAERRMN